MTHQYTKLADALEFHGRFGSETQDQSKIRKIKECAEAARILRAADAVDVAGLMAMILKYGELSKAHGTAIGLYGGDFLEMGRAANSEKAALESELRLALAAREGWQPIETVPQADKLLRDILSHDTARTTFYKLENGQGADTDEGRAWLAAKAWNTSAPKGTP